MERQGIFTAAVFLRLMKISNVSPATIYLEKEILITFLTSSPASEC